MSSPDYIGACSIPPLVPMVQSIDEPMVQDPRKTAHDLALEQLRLRQDLKAGHRVAITVGSRGIGGLAQVVRGLVEALKERGAQPFIVPAMGSHGGDDPAAKAKILAKLGVTPETVGAPISPTANIVQAATSPEGAPIFCQEEAFQADGIILMNRVKPHTDFKGEIESGLVKIACVGLGGKLGAQWVHQRGYDYLARRIRHAGGTAIQELKILFGLALIEGHSGSPSHLEAIPAGQIVSREKELLERARKSLLRLPVIKHDLLVVGKMGKEISGLGLDSQITGRYPSGKVPPGDGIPEIQRVVVLDLSEASEGNASGVGLCDVTTRRLYDKIDFRAMYGNVITSRGSASAKIPMVMESDQEAISVGILTCHREEGQDLGFILVRDTLHLGRFMVSPPLVAACEQAGAKSLGPQEPLRFNGHGGLVWPEYL